ncbi:Allene oxide synthase-lipoxygenase protein [Hypsibius exemplaris]|uniref:Allene oxide synthase-lipoxygenase protein n=1 Tax=Hypsibius exemplaris TaxID=2072580 RepID=A0A1W0XEE1_HYPEX|nr:Allene oxide synthase-lipoxygenase protein [Hypsibius exemplaris]
MPLLRSVIIPSTRAILEHIEHHADSAPWIIHVKTGDRKGAGTDATVWAKLADENDLWTQSLKLSTFGVNTHERGQVDTFALKTSDFPPEFGRVVKLELWRESVVPLSTDDWFLEVLTAENIITGVKAHFPVLRWIENKKRYFYHVNDAVIPQKDQFAQQRQAELVERKKTYQLEQKQPGLPMQAATLPEDEKFSFGYSIGIAIDKRKYLADTRLTALTTGGKSDKWDSLEEVNQMYKFTMPKPGTEAYWKDDAWFGQQRLQGVNPVMIRLATAPLPNFPVDEEKVKQILGGVPLTTAIALKRIFYVDLKIMENLECKDKRVVTAPIAMFYLDERREKLLPLAIQLFQKPALDNPIFYPTNEPQTWLLAKMYFNNADANYHQSCTHLGLTHLLMEGVVVCAHRNLSPSHPIFKLLAPHFLYLIAIDELGLKKLISVDGWVDKTLVLGNKGMFELIRRGKEAFRLDVTATPPVDCKVRGVDSPTVLPNYPYRDDAIAVYNAIHKYVETIVKHFYKTAEEISGDSELQNFGRELVLPQAEKGVGLGGVPITDGRFRSVQEIVDTVSAIISQCSLSHAAANFGQYEEYGYPPNYPTRMNGAIPTKTSGYTEKDIVDQLPTKATTLDIMVITRLLSSRDTNSLGDFEVQYLYDTVSVQAARQFRHDLEGISIAIKARNEKVTTPYVYAWLDPECIPNAISI